MINPINQHPPKGETEMTRKANSKVTAIDEVEADEVEAEVTYSAKDLALELGTDAKSFRRWLRAHTEDRANKGGRWLFTPESKAAIIEAYNTKAEGTEPTLIED